MFGLGFPWLPNGNALFGGAAASAIPSAAGGRLASAALPEVSRAAAAAPSSDQTPPNPTGRKAIRSSSVCW